MEKPSFIPIPTNPNPFPIPRPVKGSNPPDSPSVIDLPPLLKRYAEALVIEPDLRKAAELAFLPKRTPQRVLDEMAADARLISYVHSRRRDIALRNGVTEEEIISHLRSIRDTAIQSGKFADAIRATELLGKYLGMFDRTIKAPSQLFLDPKSTDSSDARRLQKIGNLSTQDPVTEKSF